MTKIFEEQNLNAKSFKGYPLIALWNVEYSLLILLKSHWEAAIEKIFEKIYSAKIFEYVFFKIANLQSLQLHLCSKSMKNTCEGVQL